MKKRQHCFNCGEDLGIYSSWPVDIETCGSPDCEREARYEWQAAESERREAAEDDNYGRY